MSTSPEVQIVIDSFATLDRLQPEPFFEFFADDVSIVDEISKKWLHGKKEAVATWTPILAGMQSCKTVLSDFHVAVAGDISIVTCMLDQTYVYEGQSITVTAPTTCLVRMDNGALKLILAHTIPFAD
jgi:ketosteroid isomerase-like protein